MKKIILLLILLGSKNLSAQTNNDKLILAKCKKPLIEVYKTHGVILDKIENYLLEISQIEQPVSSHIRDHKIDSIKRIHNLNLCDYYLQLRKNNEQFYPLIKSKEDALLISNFVSERFVKIDQLYRSFVEEKKVEKVIENTTNNKINDTVKPIFEIGPTIDACKDSPLGIEACSYQIIYKAIMNNYAVPEIRIIENSLFKILVSFRINKEGIVEAIRINKTSGYFEFDMEAINVINRIGKNKKFNPAKMNDKAVEVYYTIPINVMSQQD
ncbi:energy transducer TonB [Flavobacterium sp.]|uniref:energy transducer TonB n=1 Tax=Flavobacterium sp. TaxID=239 RepID=UPI002630B6FF|nr:energy transducer TonB [Flavobacterium sp.]